MSETEKEQFCNVCDEIVPGPFCQDGACKTCHKSVSWEDCTDGTYSARNMLENGWPRATVLSNYPNARIQ